MPTDEVKDSAQPLRPASPPMPLGQLEDTAPPPERPATPPLPTASPGADGEGVGGVMVQGAPEVLEFQAADAEDIAVRAELEPAALDEEVAATIAAAEAEDERPPTPPIIRRASPAPTSLRPEEVDGPQGDEAEMAMDLDVGDETGAGPSRPSERGAAPSTSPALGKRGGEASVPDSVDRATPPNAPKRPRRTYTTPLPPALSHLLHPPTSVLYITNLRRPLLIPTLHEYVFASSSASSSRLLPEPRVPFASADHPGLWLSGVKDHAYAAFDTTEDATAAAERIEGRLWPEEVSSSASAKLKVQFVPDERVEELVREEEAAWARGRQKLNLEIKRGEDGRDWDFVLVGSGGLGGVVGRGGRGDGRAAGPDVSARQGGGGPAPRGPVNVRPPGRSSFVTPVTGSNGLRGAYADRKNSVELFGSRDQGASFGRRGPPGMDQRRLGQPMQRTTVRPPLAYREGPGAAR